MQRSKFEAFAIRCDGRSGSLPLPEQRVACEGLRKPAIGQVFFSRCLINALTGQIKSYFKCRVIRLIRS